MRQAQRITLVSLVHYLVHFDFQKAPERQR